MNVNDRNRRDRRMTQVVGIGAGLAFLFAIGLLVMLDDPRWGASALALYSSLAGTFALFGMQSSRRRQEEAELLTSQAPAASEVMESGLPVHPVTGLYRSWIFRERLEEEIARASRHDHDLSMLVLELADQFEEPPLEVYTRAAKALRDALRTEDFAAQYDDERFAVLLPETDKQEAQATGKRLLADLRASSEPELRWAGVVITYPQDGSDAEVLLNKAVIVLRQRRVAEAPTLPPATPGGGEAEPKESQSA